MPAEQLGRYAFRHAVPILLAPRAAPSNGVRNASGFFVRLPEGVYLGTAWHVVQHWINARAHGAPLLFQLGDDVALNPERSLAWRDEANDIAFIRVTNEQVAMVDASVCEPLTNWPPDHPVPDGDVFIAGFPGRLRRRDGHRADNFRRFAAHLVIQEVRDRYVGCVLNQDLDLGGMSGGPAFFAGHSAYPLVALVRDCALGVVRLATLSHVDGLR